MFTGPSDARPLAESPTTAGGQLGPGQASSGAAANLGQGAANSGAIVRYEPPGGGQIQPHAGNSGTSPPRTHKRRERLTRQEHVRHKIIF